MKMSFRSGLSFGITSGIITTLGLIVGLQAGTNSKLAVIGGILTIAIADAFSDALGVHVSQESEDHHTTKEIWEATGSTFLAKLLIALSFLVPVLLLDLRSAVLASVAWGLLMLVLMNMKIAGRKSKKTWKVVGEHLLIAIAVIIIAHFVGTSISGIFAG